MGRLLQHDPTQVQVMKIFPLVFTQIEQAVFTSERPENELIKS